MTARRLWPNPMLRSSQRGGEHIQVFGGGGGVIVPSEIRDLQAYGVARIYSPEDGQRMGLAGMIGEMVMRCDGDLSPFAPTSLDVIQGGTEPSWRALAQLITALENGKADARILRRRLSRCDIQRRRLAWRFLPPALDCRPQGARCNGEGHGFPTRQHAASPTKPSSSWCTV
jgi:hypothetical protein